jgi:LysM repeat protein
MAAACDFKAKDKRSRHMTGAVATIDRTSGDHSALPQGGAEYRIQRGDTLGEIAKQHGTDVATLARLNGITNADLIYAGETIQLPGGGNSHTVQRGDTLSEIAAANGTSVAALMRANPEIRNANQIYPGQAVRIQADGGGQFQGTSPQPAPSGNTQATTGVQSTTMQGGRLSLSQTDIDNIKKTLQTEWVQSAGDDQARGIIDTILNRTASGHWGSTVADVVNARNQFSDINGPPARRKGRDSVEEYPMAQVSRRVSDFVDTYLAQRAAGTPSSVGSHLNYANPNYSDAVNLGWINALDGPVFGRGDAIHRHGTTPDLERHRPGNFTLALPGSASETPAPARVGNENGAAPGNGFVNPTGGAIRNDSGGEGHYHASRRRANGPGLHHGLDILSTAGQAVRAPISGTLRQVNPNNVHSGFEIVSSDGRTAVRVFYAAPNRSLIGQQVSAGDVVATAQDLQMRGQYSANVRDHVHVEIRTNGNLVDPAPFFFR